MLDKSPLRVVVIGAGMAGILAGVRLLERGNSNFAIYEKGHGVGGTWRENRYPGLTCDVPAHAYTYSFAPNPEWSAFYAGGREIEAYFQKVFDDHGLGEYTRFDTEVTGCEYDDDTHKWTVTLSDGTTDIADVVIAASGVLHHPNYPEIEGMDSFEGRMFHTARWEDDVELDGKRVGVIGNGSTGIQLVTALADRAETLVQFQRSPQWIFPGEQFEYPEEQKAAFRENLDLIDQIRFGDEYWDGIRRFNKALVDTEGPEMKAIEQICLDNLENSVSDPELKEKLRPDYRAGCKRLIYSWCYYDKVQQPSVVVERRGIDRIIPTGVRMDDGSEHELDVLLLATGFEADRFIRPTTVTGRGGVDLDDAWAKRPTAFMAISIPDFPNFFMLNGPTGPVGNFSLIDIAEKQWVYIAQLMDKLAAGEAQEISPSHEAMADYEERRIAAAKNTIFGTGCNSWYLDDEGVPSSWPWSYEAFDEAMAEPELEKFDIR